MPETKEYPSYHLYEDCLESVPEVQEQEMLVRISELPICDACQTRLDNERVRPSKDELRTALLAELAELSPEALQERIVRAKRALFERRGRQIAEAIEQRLTDQLDSALSDRHCTIFAQRSSESGTYRQVELVLTPSQAQAPVEGSVVVVEWLEFGNTFRTAEFEFEWKVVVSATPKVQ